MDNFVAVLQFYNRQIRQIWLQEKQMSIEYVTFSNLIIDDIVFPDGQSRMNALGGSGTHALVGMSLWNQQLGYAASVGEDLDQAHRISLHRFGVNLPQWDVIPFGEATKQLA
ncbi:MAG: hypothetical protein ACI9EW_001196 [Cellvibrionaceae bacterium]